MHRARYMRGTSAATSLVGMPLDRRFVGSAEETITNTPTRRAMLGLAAAAQFLFMKRRYAVGEL